VTDEGGVIASWPPKVTNRAKTLSFLTTGRGAGLRPSMKNQDLELPPIGVGVPLYE